VKKVFFFQACSQHYEKLLLRFVMSVRHHRTRLPLDGFSWHFILQDFSKIWRKMFTFHENLTESVHVSRKSDGKCSRFTKIWRKSVHVSRKSDEKVFIFHENLTSMTGTLHEDQCTFMIICRSVLLRMRNVSEVVKKIKTHMLSSINIFRKLCNLWECGNSMIEPHRPHMTIQDDAE
jgi:hypothetical protein